MERMAERSMFATTMGALSLVKTRSLRAHILRHDIVRQFECPWPLCGKKFLRLDELNDTDKLIQERSGLSVNSAVRNLCDEYIL